MRSGMKKVANILSSFETRLSYILIVLLTVILSVASAARDNSHIRVGLIDMFVSPRTLKFINYIADVIVIIFNIIIVWFGVQLMISSVTYGEKTPATNIPMAIIYAVIPICFALMVFRILGYTSKDIFGKSDVIKGRVKDLPSAVSE